MPDQKLVSGITWDGRGQVYIHEYTFPKESEKKIVDRGRNKSYLSTEGEYVNVPNNCWLIHQDSLNDIKGELEKTHRLLHENSQSLVLARNNAESDLVRYQSQNSSLQNQIYSLQSRNSSLEAEKSNLQSLINAGQRELNTKNNQIATYSTQLTSTQNQLNQSQNQLTIRNNAFDALTQQFNALQIESNNKDNVIDNLREELDGSRNIDLRYREKKLDELVRNSGLNRERIDNLRAAYERLKLASNRESYNQERINASQNEIDTIKREFFQANVSVDDLHKIYRVCEKVAELRVNLQQQPQFEARQQEVPPRGGI